MGAAAARETGARAAAAAPAPAPAAAAPPPAPPPPATGGGACPTYWRDLLLSSGGAITRLSSSTGTPGTTGSWAAEASLGPACSALLLNPTTCAPCACTAPTRVLAEELAAFALLAALGLPRAAALAPPQPPISPQQLQRGFKPALLSAGGSLRAVEVGAGGEVGGRSLHRAAAALRGDEMEGPVMRTKRQAEAAAAAAALCRHGLVTPEQAAGALGSGMDDK